MLYAYIKSFSYLTLFAVLSLFQTSVLAGEIDFQQYLKQGDQALSSGQLNEAFTAFSKAAALQSESEVIQQRLGTINLLKGRYRSSIQHFHKTLGFNEKNIKAFIGLGLAYLHIGQYPLAKAALQDARQYSDSKNDIDLIIKWLENK